MSAGHCGAVRQRGMSFFGLLFFGGLLAALGVVLAQAVPTVIEYQAVTKAARKAREGSTVAEIRAIFDRYAAVDNIDAIRGKDLEVTKDSGDKVVVSFSYQREIHLGGPAYLTLKYSNQVR